MPKSRNDPYKRKAAQALNHNAAAILDINEIYNAFDEQLAKLYEIQANDPTPEHQANAERYEKLTAKLKTNVMLQAAIRQELLQFIDEVWQLDEESIKVYMG